MNEPFDISTVIFALLAVFVVWKLRSVLGTRTGTERPPGEASPVERFSARRKADSSTGKPAPGETGKVIRLPSAAGDRSPGVAEPEAGADWAPYLDPQSPALDGLLRIQRLDSTFTAESFMQGARAAYEMIVTAFATGNRDALAPLLAKDVLEGFASAIVDREKRGDKVETTFVSMDESKIEDAQLRDRTAQVTIRFQSKMISVTRNREGAVIDGSSEKVSDVKDVWTFARDVDSRNPNWRLIATDGGA